MSGIGMAFQAWLAGRIGAAGIGLYQLVLSVTGLSATFAISGIRFASTRLVAEELGLEHSGGMRAAMGRCLVYGTIFGSAAAVILWNLAPLIGNRWIGDGRTVRALRIAAFSMPCVSLCASVSGYFTACGRLVKPTLIHLAEELLGAVLVALFLRGVPAGELEKSCAAVSLGRLSADLFCTFLMLAAWMLDRYDAAHEEETDSRDLTERMLKIALPLALSAYARSTLTTLQQLLVPRGLKAAGFSADAALSGYGTIQGMALPVLLFPACIPGAASQVIVPDLTASQVRGESAAIRRTAGGFLRAGILYSLAVGTFLFLMADALGMMIYDSREAGHYIRLLAPLVPIMYIDACVDGCLRGLGQQVWCMGINVLDGIMGLLLTWQLLPRFALAGYIGILYATELFNFTLSAGRLGKIMRAYQASAALT